MALEFDPTSARPLDKQKFEFDQTSAAPEPKRTWGQALKDTGAQLAEGVNTAIGAVPDLIAPDSAASKLFRDNAEYWRDQQSDPLKQRIAATDKRIQEAGKEGVVSQIGTAVSEYVNDPAQAARLVATNIPSMVPGLAVGKAAQAATAARGLGAAQRAAVATGAASATNAAMNAGGARGEAFDDLQRAHIAQGATPDQAREAALSESLLPAAVGGVAGAVSGKVGLEKAVLGQASKGAAVRKGLGAFGAEMAGEQVEEVAPQIATNFQVGQVDPQRGLMNDVGRTVVETALGAGPGAVVAGGVEGARTAAESRLDGLPSAGVPADQARQAAEAAAADAQAKADEAAPQWTTAPGAADPNAPAETGVAADANAPRVAEADFQTQPGAAPVFDNTVDFQREIDTGGLALADENQTPSQRMGLDPNAGSLSAAAALAVDSGAHDQMRQAAEAQAQAEAAAKGPKASQPEAGALESAAAKAQPLPQAPAAEQPALTQREQQRLASSLAGSDLSRESIAGANAQELQAKLDEVARRAAENGSWNVPLMAQRRRIEEAKAALQKAGPNAEPISTTTKGPTDGAQAAQAQQASPPPAQAGAAQTADPASGGARTQAVARTPAPGALTDGATTANDGAKAAPAAGPQAQAQGGEVEALRQQLRDVEAKIIQAAPDAMGQGGGDIEAAMKSRKVPVPLKLQRKALVEQVRSAQADEVKAFAPETGTLGIPRAEMPQVPTQSHGALVNHLNAQGIAHETTMVDASSLKPTQAEYSPAKVEKAKTASGDRAVIVSSDGHIIDGHHQALAAAEEGKPVKAIVLDALVEQALEAVKNSPSAVNSDAALANDTGRVAFRRRVLEMIDREADLSPEWQGVFDQLPPPLVEAAYTVRGLQRGLEQAREVLDGEDLSVVERSTSLQLQKLAPKMAELYAAIDFLHEQTIRAQDRSPASDQTPIKDATSAGAGAAPAAKDGEGGAAGRAADAQPDAGGPAGRPDTAAPVAGVQPAVPDGGGAGQQPAGVTKQAGPGKIADFGEKIGGARKDLAGSSAAKPARARNDDPRPAWARRFEISQIAKSSRVGEEGRWVVRDTRSLDAFKQPRRVGSETYATREEAEQAVPLIAVSQKHRAVPVRGDGNGYEIWRDVSDRKRVKVVDQVFATRMEALEYMADHAQEIIETNTTFGEADLSRPPSEERVGAARRSGDVKDADFGEVFGFRGVEFGNWNNQEERQQLLNDAYDGLLDLAEVVGIPPRGISLNGELALAFGARGHGLSGARAHYERDKAVINLTKMNGAGSLAHEWFHAMDHYFARLDGKASAEWVLGKDGTRSLRASSDATSDYASGGTRGDRSGMRAELREAYAGLMHTIARKAEQYVEDTAKADQFVANARNDVQQRLDSIRRDLASTLDERYYKRLNKPASAEQLAEFDTIAEKIVAGELLELRVGSKAGARSALSGIRWTNDALDRISAIMKAVRGRQGFSADQTGVLDRLRADMQRYSMRLKMLADAQASNEKTRMVPTQFAMDAKELDQGRGQDYWTTPHEMAARAFQGYVEDKVAEGGGRSPFLNYGPENVGIPTPWGFKRPFPTGTERKAINQALDKLMGVIQTREGDDGKVVLFRRDSSDGFDFEAAARAVLGQASGFSSAAREQAVSSVRQTVDAIRAAWGPNAPEVVVAFDMQDDAIPAAARRADLRQRSGGARGAPEGFYYRGTAYLMASRLTTPTDAARVLFHEVLGHHGLRGKFGRDLDLVLNQVATMRKAEVAAKMQEYGLRGVKGLSVREAAEEVLAEMAEKTPQLHFVQRAIAAIRNFLREHIPGFRNLRLTDSDIVQAYILPARGWVERSAGDREAVADPEFGVNFARHPGFSAAVDAAVKAGTMGESGGRSHVEIGTLPQVLSVAGVPAGDLKTSAKVLQKVVFDHGVPPSVVKRIPELLERPVMVFRSASVDGSFVAVTSEMVRGAPLIVAISPETTRGAVALNFVPSLYPRDDLQAIQRWLNATKPGEQLLTYLDKEQSPAWFGSTRLQLPGEYRTAQGLQSRSVKTQADVVNGEGGEADAALFSRSKLQDIKASALEQIQQAMTHPGKVSLWDKTVGTMRHLAERAPAFKPVFESAQRQIDDVSMLANDAADQAPRLLPRVETLADLKKKPISAEDNKAVARPLFEGTLMWGRDVDGKPVLVDDLSKKYGSLPADDKAQLLLRAGRIDDGVLKMWRGLPLAQYEANINSRFENRMLKAGVVWSEKELRDLFGLNANQVSLYQEGRAAIDRSIDMTARADMLRALGAEYAPMRDAVLEQSSLDDAVELLTRTLQDDMRSKPDMADRLAALNNAVVDRHEKARELMAQGYAPLSRFGRYTVDVVDAAGERQYFGMFESPREANIMGLKMRDLYPGAKVNQGTMSAEAYKLFQGVTPESLELFGNMLGLDAEGSKAQDKAFQQYLQLAKNNQSALKRLIHRKGIAGYSEDVGRVLASFVYSNARQAAGGLNAGAMDAAINGIPKEQGELRDVAMGLRDYVRDPQEEGQAVRGMLFAQYLGGSLASAFVNMTQPFAVTLPWLSQNGGMKNAGAQLARALKDMGTKGFKYKPGLAHALKSAEDDGVVSPQEIHQLMAQARGAGTLRSGDGTRLGNARATLANRWEQGKVLWGQPFALAEQFNRRSTFIAAYRLAEQQGMDRPAEFARRAVLETQFLYSKANKPKWARGAVGGTLFTFKTYSVSYLELMQRMWTQGGPEGKRAVGWALVMLMLMGGAGGLPFMEDLEDLIDGAGQLMGYNMSLKQSRKQLLRDVLGKELGEFLEQGVSGLPGAPVDVSGRLGMGNLLPGTGLLLSKPNRERDLLEIAGPAGDLVARGFKGARKLLTGDVAGAALEVSPTAVRNAVKGADMAASGMYKDAKGYKVLDTTLAEAAAKAIGFQPRSVAEVQEANSYMLRSKSFYTQTSSDIKAQWADALFRKDDAALERARERLAAWNRDNPEQPIVVKMPDVWKRVREMGKDRTQRIADTAPKAMRQQMREMAREARGPV